MGDALTHGLRESESEEDRRRHLAELRERLKPVYDALPKALAVSIFEYPNGRRAVYIGLELFQQYEADERLDVAGLLQRLGISCVITHVEDD